MPAQRGMRLARRTEKALAGEIDPSVADGRNAHLECAICHYPSFSDMVVTTCDHVFHEHCVSPWLRDHGSCPMCRAALPSGPSAFKPVPPCFRAILGNTEVKCPQECGKAVDFEQLRNHIEEQCGRTPFDCGQCDATVERVTLQQHLRNECAQRRVSCPNTCGEQDIVWGDLDAHLVRCTGAANVRRYRRMQCCVFVLFLAVVMTMLLALTLYADVKAYRSEVAALRKEQSQRARRGGKTDDRATQCRVDDLGGESNPRRNGPAAECGASKLSDLDRADIMREAVRRVSSEVGGLSELQKGMEKQGEQLRAEQKRVVKLEQTTDEAMKLVRQLREELRAPVQWPGDLGKLVRRGELLDGLERMNAELARLREHQQGWGIGPVPERLLVRTAERPELGGVYSRLPETFNGAAVWGNNDKRVFRNANEFWMVTGRSKHMQKNEGTLGARLPSDRASPVTGDGWEYMPSGSKHWETARETTVTAFAGTA
eukprot:TRINITY_DN26639_c0_g1_i1.p1 TRINITY_DN26639_c0_g1~~TRINITY_DN26639_c0_g1_i1.p1  ORF type:complete len:515 (+),score=139.16 TRINITY_DN26639_c0_g1_i1:88-1545(+)